MHDDASRLVAESTYDFNEFLLNLVNQGSFNLDLKPIPLRLAYHIPCQYRAHRLPSPGLHLLGLIPGLTMVDTMAACCGIAGTYGYKAEKYNISMAVGNSLFEFITTNFGSSPVVVCDSETCRWQITHATSKPAIHPVELIAKSYGLTITGSFL